MSFGRILLAAILGGALVFGWGFVSHELLGVGAMVFKSMPAAGEQAVVGSMDQASLGRGAYWFPEFPEGELSKEQMQAYTEVYEAGPRGIVFYDPTVMTDSFPKMLGTEYLSGTVAALMAAIIAAGVRGGYAGRVATVTLMGLFAWVSIDVSYWNWYRFPEGFAMAGLIDSGVGWLLAGLVIAAIAKPTRVVAVAPA